MSHRYRRIQETKNLILIFNFLQTRQIRVTLKGVVFFIKNRQIMPEYGSVEYWDRRYGDATSSEPFDWLFDYNDVKHVLEQLMPDKSVPILMVGAGNAPFSPDMYFQGF